jgi:hypothetical protein
VHAVHPRVSSAPGLAPTQNQRRRMCGAPTSALTTSHLSHHCERLPMMMGGALRTAARSP